jgi:PAS domain S-box-containing protein
MPVRIPSWLEKLPLFEQAPVPYHILDQKGTILAVNQAWRELLGWTSDEAVGRAFVELVSSRDQERIEETLFEAQEGENVRCAVNLNTGAETRMPVELHGRGGFASNQGGPISFWCTVTASGQTQGRSSVEHFTMERVLDHLPAAVTIKDAQEKILYANRSFAEIAQRQPEELIGLKSAEITPPDLLEQYQRENLQVLAGETVRQESEFPGPEGPTFWITDKFPIPQADGSTLVGSISSEITERVETEQRLERIQGQLQKSEAKFRQLAEHAQDMIVLFDPEYRVQYLNPAAERILGYQEEDFEDQGIFDVIHPEDVAELREKIQENIADKKASDLKSFRILGSQGECVWCEAATSYEYDKRGELQSVLVNARDVTRRKELEQDLQDSGERFRAIYQKTPVMMHSIDREGRLVQVSDYWLKVMGYQRSEVVGRRSIDFLTEESRRYAQEAALPEFFKEGEAWNVHYQFVTKTGQVLDVLMSAVAEYDQQGEYVRSLAVMEDVTERFTIQRQLQESEQKYRRLVDNSPDIFYIYSLDRGTLFWSRQVQETLGYEAEALLKNPLRWNQAIHPQDRHRVRETLQNLEAGDSFTLEYRVFDREGFRHWFLDRSVSVRGQDGEIVIEGLLKDITPRKQLEIIQSLRLELAECRDHRSVQELLRLALDRAEEVTESWIGFCHEIDDDQQSIRLQTWSTHTEALFGGADAQALGSKVGAARFWSEAARLRQTVIENDGSSLEERSGNSDDPAPPVRFLAYPVIRQEQVVAVFGLGNKPTPYSEKDLELVSQIAEHTWDVVEQKRVQTALKQSESRYRGIVEDQVELICRYAPDGELTFVNQAYADFFGYSAHELIGFNLFKLMPEEERDQVRQKYLDLTPEDPETRYRHQNYAADGSLRWVEWTDRAIFNSQDKLAEYQSVGYEVHEQVQLEQALKKREEEYQELVGYLQQSREEERSLLASEIHDSLGQSLTVMRFDLDWAMNHIPETHPEVRERLESTMGTVKQTISQVRKIGVGLRPDLLDNLGLVAALDWLRDNFGERSELAFRLEVSGREERLDPELEVDIFRLAQEAVTNVARHAEAEEVELRLYIGEHAVRLEVADDGKGITPRSVVGPESFGLVSMRERTRRWDGDFSVRNNELGGTTLQAVFSRKGYADD